MRVLITGGNGFLGAWIASRLLQRDIEVQVFDVAEDRRLLNTIAGAAARTVQWTLGDIVDTAAVSAATAGCDGIIHLAGILTPACQADPVRGALINYVGTLNAFEAARRHGIGHLVYTSSAGVFGGASAALPHPITHYGAAKLACEGSARAYWEDHRIGSLGFRPFVVYGPGRESGLTAGPSLACRAAVRGEAYVIPYTGRVGLVFVDDVAAAYERALLDAPAGAQVFNICGQSASNEEVVEAIRALLPGARLAVQGPDVGLAADVADDDLYALYPDLPRTGLSAGIARTVRYYQDLRRNAP